MERVSGNQGLVATHRRKVRSRPTPCRCGRRHRIHHRGADPERRHAVVGASERRGPCSSVVSPREAPVRDDPRGQRVSKWSRWDQNPGWIVRTRCRSTTDITQPDAVAGIAGGGVRASVRAVHASVPDVPGAPLTIAWPSAKFPRGYVATIAAAGRGRGSGYRVTPPSAALEEAQSGSGFLGLAMSYPSSRSGQSGGIGEAHLAVGGCCGLGRRQDGGVASERGRCRHDCRGECSQHDLRIANRP